MKYLCMLLMSLMLPGLAAGQTKKLPLTLKHAVELALSPEGNARLQISEDALVQAKARSDQARAALLPDVASNLTYRDQTVNLRSFGVGNGFPFPLPALVGPFSVADARISGSQTIFDFSSIRRFQASRSGVSAAQAEVASIEEQVAAQVARAYLLGIRADADVQTARANVRLSEELLEQAESQKQAGTGTGIEITRARVQLANDKQRLLVAENARRAAHLQLLRTIDLELDIELELTDQLGYLPVDPLTLEEAVRRAVAERPDLKAQQQRERSAQLSSSATRLERLPSLGFFGEYGSVGSDINDAYLPTRIFGVTLKIPIFDGGRRDARRVEAASQYRAERVRTEDLRRQIELEIRLALDALQSADEQVKVAREGLALSQNELAQAQRRFEAGVAIGLEVTDAQTRLARARDNQIQALYNYNLARIDLEQAMGRVRGSVQKGSGQTDD